MGQPLCLWKRSPPPEIGWLCLTLKGCSLLVTSQRGWYKTENEYYLLQFTLTVRCLYYTSFSLELCWQPPPAERPFYSLPWMLAYVFYYPVFHNGPVLSFPEFIAQVEPFEDCMGVPARDASVLVYVITRESFHTVFVESLSRV